MHAGMNEWIIHCLGRSQDQILMRKVLEFLLWCNRIGSISGTLGCWFNSWLCPCCSYSIGHICGSDLTPGVGTPYPAGRPRKKKRRKLFFFFFKASINKFIDKWKYLLSINWNWWKCPGQGKWWNTYQIKSFLMCKKCFTAYQSFHLHYLIWSTNLWNGCRGGQGGGKTSRDKGGYVQWDQSGWKE